MLHLLAIISLPIIFISIIGFNITHRLHKRWSWVFIASIFVGGLILPININTNPMSWNVLLGTILGIFFSVMNFLQGEISKKTIERNIKYLSKYKRRDE